MTLITRPRRFGKPPNMSMTACFFSNQFADRGDLFEGLDIWNDEKYRQLQGTCPVIFLSFAGVKADRYADMEYRLTETLSKLYEQNRYLLSGGLMSENEIEYYNRIKPGMDKAVATRSRRIHVCTGES